MTGGILWRFRFAAACQTVFECPTDVAYSSKHLKDKLKAKYGDNVCIVQRLVAKNVLWSFIVNGKWYAERNFDAEKESEIIVRTAAK